MSKPAPVFDQINIVARDMAAAVEFYRLLGVDIADTHAAWERHHREIASTGDGVDAELDSSTFARRWNVGWPEGSVGVVVGFRVDSRDAVDELYQRMTGAGYRGQQAPYDAFWGARYAVIEDPDGNAVGIMSPSEDRHRSAPPDPSEL